MLASDSSLYIGSVEVFHNAHLPYNEEVIRHHSIHLRQPNSLDTNSFNNLLVAERIEELSRYNFGRRWSALPKLAEHDVRREDQGDSGGDDEGEQDLRIPQSVLRIALKTDHTTESYASACNTRIGQRGSRSMSAIGSDIEHFRSRLRLYSHGLEHQEKNCKENRTRKEEKEC